MSNHGFNSNDLPDSIKSQFDKIFGPHVMTAEQAMQRQYDGLGKLGATGRHPMGKLTPEDEGEIKFAVAADPKTKTVILDFGTPVVWMGLPREDARKLAETLLAKVRELS